MFDIIVLIRGMVVPGALEPFFFTFGLILVK